MNRRIVFWALVICFATVHRVFPQNMEDLVDPSKTITDSLLNLISPTSSDSLKAAIYIEVARKAYDSDSALRYCHLALDLCRKTDTFLLAQANHVIGWRYYQKHEMYSSIQYLRKANHLYDPDRDFSAISICSVIMSQGFETLHMPDSVFYYLNKSLENSIARNDTAQMATAYLNLGRLSINLTLYDNAEEYIVKAIDLDSLSGNKLDMACGYFWRGYLNIATKNYPQTGHYLRGAIRVLKSAEYLSSYYAMILHLAYSHMADTYISSANRTGITRYADSCLVYIQKGGDFFLRYGQTANYMIARYAYVKYLLFYKKYNEALNVLKDCEKYMSDPDLRRDYHDYLSLVYEQMGNYKEAFNQQKLHYEYAMEYLNDSSLTALADAKTHQALLFKDAEQRKADEIHRVRTHRMQLIIVSLILVLLLVLLLVLFIFRMWKIKKKALGILSQKNEILDQQKQEIQSQRDEIKLVHASVLSSIKYSERIQRAALPSDDDVARFFPESFVYFRPRDIVSGDFYHVAKCGKYNVFVVGDCTGHGIPGGFLSMLGLSSIKEFLVTEQDAADPGNVLDHMRTFIKDTLGSYDDSGSPIYDGMEMVICSFDIENHQLVYASAYLSSYIVRNDNAIRLECDKMPVGRYFNEKAHFVTHEIALQPGDMVYLFSDGIQDQPGGNFDIPEGKKLLSKNFVNLLVEAANEPARIQGEIIDQTIQFWINGREQVDDMTLVGIRI